MSRRAGRKVDVGEVEVNRTRPVGYGPSRTGRRLGARDSFRPCTLIPTSRANQTSVCCRSA